MSGHINISFDCLPMRSLGRLDIPLDASPKYRARCERILAAIKRHGSHNTYFLYNARCIYFLTNREDLGTIEFGFEGTVLTDSEDRKTQSCDVQVQMISETCDWLTEPVVNWFAETVPHSLRVEFDRYIEAGDLQRTRERIEQVQAASEESGGFLGMYL